MARLVLLLIVALAAGALLAGPLPPRIVEAGPDTPLLSNAASVATAGSHTCALISGGTVSCWGENSNGELGDGGYCLGRCFYPVPFSVTGLQSISQISAALGGSCAVSTDHVLFCWGDGHWRPAPLDGLGSVTQEVSLGDNHGCVVTTGNGVACWGSNAQGKLGDGTTGSRSSPANVPGLISVSSVAAGLIHTCAVTAAGGVKCWGSNVVGALGDGTNTDHLTPTDVPGLTGVATVAASESTCALTTEGGLTCWGLNAFGRLGDGTNIQRRRPVNVVGLSAGVAAVTVGAGHTCALTTAGGVKCWGANSSGQLGDGTTEDRYTPVDVAGLEGDVAAVSAGYNHTCAVMTSGGVKCWGRNSEGQLGDGTRFERHTPVDVIDGEPDRIGDADCSGEIGAVDAAVILQYGASLLFRLPCGRNADLNHDSRINSLDALILLQYNAGLLDEL